MSHCYCSRAYVFRFFFCRNIIVVCGKFIRTTFYPNKIDSSSSRFFDVVLFDIFLFSILLSDHHVRGSKPNRNLMFVSLSVANQHAETHTHKMKEKKCANNQTAVATTTTSRAHRSKLFFDPKTLQAIVQMYLPHVKHLLHFIDVFNNHLSYLWYDFLLCSLLG